MNVIESFVSTVLASFSKEYYLKGSKVHPFDNSLLPTRDESIAAVFSNAHSLSSLLHEQISLQCNSLDNCFFKPIIFANDSYHKIDCLEILISKHFSFLFQVKNIP